MSRYSFEVTKEAIMLFDNYTEVVMPVTFEQIAILLDVQDKEIKRLNKELKRCWKIKNININTENDPKKIESAFMNLMIELQE